MDSSDKIMVSVWCITFKHESYIRQCLEGILMQKTNFKFEVIVHDDASTDKTADIIREYELSYPDIIKPIYQTENQYSQNIEILPNFLHPSSRGKYIAICEGDDYWIDPFKLQKQVDFLEANPEYGAVHTDIEYVDTHSKIVIPPPFYQDLTKRIFNGYIWDYYLNNSGFVLTCSYFFRKNLLESRRNTYLEHCLCMDIDHWLFMDIARKAKTYFIPEKTAAYRRNPEGLMMAHLDSVSSVFPHLLLDQLYLYSNRKFETNDYYRERKTQREILPCYAKIVASALGGKIPELKKLGYVFIKNPFLWISCFSLVSHIIKALCEKFKYRLNKKLRSIN